MRLRFRFTLRSLLVFVTALGVLAGLGRYLERQLHADIDAVEALGRVADVQYQLVPRWPEWVHRFGGDRARLYWTDVDQLRIECTRPWNVALVNKSAREWGTPGTVTRPDFNGRDYRPRSPPVEIEANVREQARLLVELLDHCPRLRNLSLSGGLIDDETLESMSTLELPIKWLELENTSVRGYGIAFLQRLPQLHTLVINNADYDGQGLDQLAAVPTLRELRFRGLHEPGVCCAAIGKLAQLEILILDLPTAVDKDLGPIFGLWRLQRLSLFLDSVVGEGWNWAENSQLRSLFINGDCVTDAALVHMGRLRKLETLTLWGCPSGKRVISLNAAGGRGGSAIR